MTICSISKKNQSFIAIKFKMVKPQLLVAKGVHRLCAIQSGA